MPKIDLKKFNPEIKLPKLSLPKISLRKKSDPEIKDSQQNKTDKPAKKSRSLSPKSSKKKIAPIGVAIYADALYCTFPNESEHKRIPLEAGCVHNGAIRDFELLSKALKSLLEFVPPKTPVVIGLPPNDVMMRPIAFPEMSDSDLKSTIDLNFEEYFPFTRDEAVLDFARIDLPSNNPNILQQIHVLIATARRSCIEQVLKITQEVGMKLEAIEPLNTALLRVMPEAQENLCMIVDVNEFFTSMTVSWNGEGIFFRTSNRSKDLEATVTDILNTAQFSENQYRGFFIQKIIVTGNEEFANRIIPYLENRAEVVSLPSDYASSDGLAIRDSKGIYIDLRSRDYLALQKRKNSFNINRVAILALITTLVFALIVSVVLSILKANKLNVALDSERDFISNLQNQVRDLERENDYLHSQQRGILQILNFKREDLPVLEVMNALEANTGVGIEFRSINFGKDRSGCVATLEATAEDEELIIAMTEGLTHSGIFRNITMPSSQKLESDKINFTLILNIEDLMR